MSGVPIIGLAGLALLLSAADARAADDPYAALQLYNGAWKVKPDTGAPSRVENRCKATGLFFVCEQVVGDKTQALVVFMPTGPGAEGEQTYRTQAMGTAADAGGGWSRLTISGRRWIYEPEDVPAGQKDLERMVNVFIDDDHIHFEVQRSTDGGPWTRKSSGNEERVK
ncbi:MAG: hypothetical protein WDN04_02005 [Rhodospirillales bacterium]